MTDDAGEKADDRLTYLLPCFFVRSPVFGRIRRRRDDGEHTIASWNGTAGGIYEGVALFSLRPSDI
jgi:hypothetical protein